MSRYDDDELFSFETDYKDIIKEKYRYLVQAYSYTKEENITLKYQNKQLSEYVENLTSSSNTSRRKSKNATTKTSQGDESTATSYKRLYAQSIAREHKARLALDVIRTSYNKLLKKNAALVAESKNHQQMDERWDDIFRDNNGLLQLNKELRKENFLLRNRRDSLITDLNQQLRINKTLEKSTHFYYANMMS